MNIKRLTRNAIYVIVLEAVKNLTKRWVSEHLPIALVQVDQKLNFSYNILWTLNQLPVKNVQIACTLSM